MLLSLGILLLLAAPVAAFDFEIEPRWIAGGSGSGVGKFGEPESVAFDSLGRVVVTDKGHMRLHVYRRQDGAALFDVGGLGSDLGDFDRPNGIAVDAAGRILVVEQRNERVQILDADYRPVGAFGSRGTGPGKFLKPMGIAIDPQGRIYVTDEARADVQVFDGEGRYLWRFAHGDPRLSRVESIEVHTESGRILVCDEGRSRVNVYDLNGVFQETFGREGSGPGEFGNDPNAVRFDARGRIYVNDQGNARINVYAPDTAFLASFRSGAGGMESADGVALSERYDLFVVADQGHNRVLGFDLGEFDCRLAWVETPARAAQPNTLCAYLDPERTRLATTAWPDATLYLEARGDTGDPEVAESTVVHARSRRHPRGACLRLAETGPATGVFRAVLHLGSAGGEDHLATSDADTIRMHFAGGADLVAVGWEDLPAPEITDLHVEGRAAGARSAAAVVTQDAPPVAWRFVDPAGLRRQTAYAMRLRRAGDGALVWESGPVASGETSAVLPATAPGDVVWLELQVASGRSTSAWRQFELRRNVPPPLAEQPSPPPAARLATWPVTLAATLGPDADGDAIRAWIELELPSGPLHRSPAGRLLDGRAAWRPPGAVVPENGCIRWRVASSDGFEVRAGPWWETYVDALDEAPLPPVPLSGDSIATRATVIWRWHASRDPDPLDVVRYRVEWSRDASFADVQVMDVDTATTFAWVPRLPDGALHWRVRAEDTRGLRTFGTPSRTDLRRDWTVSLLLRSGGLASPPLALGVRGDAQDGIAGEDTTAPPLGHGPQIVSLHAELQAGLAIDLRAPRDEQVFAWEIELRGTPDAPGVLECEDRERGWAGSLHDLEGRTLGSLGAPRAAHAVRLGPGGTLRLVVRFHPDGRLPDRRNLDVRPALPATAEAAPRFALPNPIRHGSRLEALSGAAAAAEWRLFDVRGRRLRQWQGASEWTWDGLDGAGRRLPYGLYVLELRYGRDAVRRKVAWTPP